MLPPDTAVITTTFVTSEGLPVLYVMHDVEGEWQFHCGNCDYASERLQVVALRTVLSLDPSVEETLSLAEGQWALREAADAPWVFHDTAPVIVTTSVIVDRRPVLQVSHQFDETEEGAEDEWLFDGGPAKDGSRSLQVVALETLFELDPTLEAVLSLPRGESAVREARDAPWVFYLAQ